MDQSKRDSHRHWPADLKTRICPAYQLSPLARLHERLAHSPVGTGLIERAHFADACPSLSIDGELHRVNLDCR
ncbi:hypothetical protein U2P60_19610 [Brucella sp. H1_1004]|uniref:hypothetical protein n=1 Tax=Brucella sp. H1_1004 TaxID=3110109 RepID=UPI0039B6727C